MEYFIKTLSKNVRHLPIKSWYAINWPPHFRAPLNVLLRPAQREGQLKYVHQATYNKNRQSSLWVPNDPPILSNRSILTVGEYLACWKSGGDDGDR